MNKNLISVAVAATVAGAASAAYAQTEGSLQYVNEEKTGQVILFPFYNADNGNATNMHLVNTTDQVKAIKLRFVEYKNSDEVLDFNLYLSPYDHFAFGVIKDPNGTGAAVITADNSCTVPALGSPNGAFPGTATEQADGSIVRIQPFVNYQYANTKDIDSSIERTLTGHVEAIEMGVVKDDVTDTVKAGTAYAASATHGATGVPASCANLEAAWASGEWNPVDGDVTENMYTAEGGIYGLAYHINVEAAAAFGFEPTAIDYWTSTISSKSINHSNPGDLSPSLQDGTSRALVNKGNGIQYAIEWDEPIYATSAILATKALMNDVMVNPALGGQTDWVVSFPTKRFHVDTVDLKLPQVIPPFTDAWIGNTGGTSPKESPACEPVKINQWDREEAFTAPENGFSPSPAQTQLAICNEVAVIAMGTGAESALSVETGLTNLGYPYSEGWQKITMAQTGMLGDIVLTNADDASGTRAMAGLPAIGFAAFKVNNGAMSYGNAAEHKTHIGFSGDTVTRGNN
jgi:hypothetical protein